MAGKPIRVLLIVNHFPPDKNPSGKLMSQLAEGLRERGFSIDILTTLPHYEGFRIGPEHRGRLVQTESVKGDLITRVWVFASGRKHNMLHRLANYLSFALAATIAGIFMRRRYDLVLANSGSFFTGIAGTVLRSLRGAPFIYNVQDIYPDVPVKAGQLRNRHAIDALGAIEKFMYRRAAHVTVISEEQRSILIGKGVPAEKLEIIPNFVDTAFIRPLPKQNAFAARHGLSDKFVVAYAGNLGLVYDFESLVACAARFRDRSDVLFLIVGDGVRKAEVAKLVAGLDNVRLIDFQPESDLPEMRAAIDVHLSLYKSGAAQSSLPSKIYEIMASGRPALASAEKGTALRMLIDQAECGLCVDPDDAESLYEALMRLYNDRALCMRLGDNGRRAAVENYSRDVAVTRYSELFARLMNVDKAQYAHE
jgi:colanic acid biosynthesis glycosyl transferase WcaI